MRKLKSNISILILGVWGHLTIGHTLRTFLHPHAKFKFNLKAIFEIMSGIQSVTMTDDDNVDATK